MNTCEQEFYKNTAFYRIMRDDMTHFDFRYKEGINIFKGYFNDCYTSECGPGGLYFTTAENLYSFYGYYYAERIPCHIRRIVVPVNDPLLKVVNLGTKYRANRIFVSEKVQNDKEIFELLKGMSILHLKTKISNLSTKSPITSMMILNYLDTSLPYHWCHLDTLDIEWRNVVDQEFIKKLVQKNDNLKYMTHPNTALFMRSMDENFTTYVTKEVMKKNLKAMRLHNWRFFADLDIDFVSYVDEEIILHQISKEDHYSLKCFDEYRIEWKYLLNDIIIDEKRSHI